MPTPQRQEAANCGGLLLRLGIAGSGLLLLLLRGQLVPFEFGGPTLEIFSHVHETKAARIVPPEFLCQPQARAVDLVRPIADVRPGTVLGRKRK